MNLDAKHFILSHLVWLVAALISIFAIHAWIGEHDQRLLAEKQIQISDAAVKDLRAQVAANHVITVEKIRTVTKIVHDAQTPAQVIAAVPQLTDAPLNARSIPASSTEVAVNAPALATELGQCKSDRLNLDSCQFDLKAENNIVVQKDAEIKALKHPKSFFKRFTGALKAVGVGVGIGVLIGAHVL